MNRPSLRRTAALLEVIGIYLAGGLVSHLLLRATGVTLRNPLANLSVNITNAQLIAAARDMFVLLMFQYAGVFLLAVPINWWHRRSGPAAYGLTMAGRSFPWLLLAGLATAALCEWPVMGLSLWNALHPSQTAPWRQAFFDMSWNRWEFWLFSAVMSWALIPVVEELLYRGYVQRRLAEDWGNGPAIIGTACLFTFQHTQYQQANAYSIGMIGGLFLCAVGFGVIFAYTRSLIPGIIAHSIIDIPMTPMWQGLLVAALVAGAIFAWRRGRATTRQVFSDGNRAAYATLAILGTAVAIVSARVNGGDAVAVAMVVAAVVLEAISSRSASSRRDPQPTA